MLTTALDPYYSAQEMRGEVVEVVDRTHAVIQLSRSVIAGTVVVHIRHTNAYMRILFDDLGKSELVVIDGEASKITIDRENTKLLGDTVYIKLLPPSELFGASIITVDYEYTLQHPQIQKKPTNYQEMWDACKKLETELRPTGLLWCIGTKRIDDIDTITVTLKGKPLAPLVVLRAEYEGFPMKIEIQAYGIDN